MKLYATTTSERASKGQGGNKEIVIDIRAGSTARELIARIKVFPSPYDTTEGYENYIVQWVETTRQEVETGNIIHGEVRGVSKGKQKKDECAECIALNKALPNLHGKGSCDKHE